MTAPLLDVSDFEVVTSQGVRRALVVTPAERLRVGRTRIDSTNAGDRGSAVDDEIVAKVSTWPEHIDVVLLRSWGGTEDRSWGFDPALSDDEVDELGYQLMRDQLAFFRRIIALGTYAIAATDLSAREFDAMVRGTMRLGRELSARVGAGAASDADALDRWILDHFSLWTTRPFHEFVLQGLPSLFTLVDRHAQKLADLTAKISADDRAR
jgi:hypothetical protein